MIRIEFRKIVVIAFCITMLMGTSSCLVLYDKDNGNHKGWYKGKRNNEKPRGKRTKRKTRVKITTYKYSAYNQEQLGNSCFTPNYAFECVID